jgi:hypothetical protein
MKVIFLDNDGVICLDNNWGGRTRKFKKWNDEHPHDHVSHWKDMDVHHRFDDFDRKAIKTLNSILEQTGAEIIVSSDWRKQGTLEELGEYYLAQGVIKKPIAITTTFIGVTKPDNFEWIKKLQYEQERSLEITGYLEKNPNITHWVAVDDLNMSLHENWGLTNFVHTPRMSEGIKQLGIKEKIINFLT